MFFDKTTQFRVVQQAQLWDIKGGYAKPVEFICQIPDFFQRHPECIKSRCQASTAGSRKEFGFQTFFLRKLSILQDGPLPDRHRHRGPVQAFSDSLHSLIFSTFQAGSAFYNLFKSHLDSLIINEKNLSDLKTPKDSTELLDISVYWKISAI